MNLTLTNFSLLFYLPRAPRRNACSSSEKQIFENSYSRCHRTSLDEIIFKEETNLIKFEVTKRIKFEIEKSDKIWDYKSFSPKDVLMTSGITVFKNLFFGWRTCISSRCSGNKKIMKNSWELNSQFSLCIIRCLNIRRILYEV